MEIIEANSTNFLVRREDGSTTLKTRSSDLNKLMFGHNLWGFLDAGNEVWTSEGEDGEPSVTIIPDDDAECYTIQFEDRPQLVLGKHHKTDLVDVMMEYYEQDSESLKPVLDLYERIRSNMVRRKLLKSFLPVFSDKVEEQDEGWYINGHLLLTYEGEFYHSNHVSRNRSGEIIGHGMSEVAYAVDVDPIREDMERDVTVEGTDYRLTDGELEFLARTVWAVKNTPDRRDE